MSMQTPFTAEIPEETRRLVEPPLAADSVYRLVGNEIDQVISDEDFLIAWFGSQCQSCAGFGPGLCTDGPNGRCLSINAYHDMIQARRQDLLTSTEIVVY